MAAAAGRQALERAGLEQVDLLIVSTASPDFPLPPMATLVQDELGLLDCTVLEIRSGCAGAVEALDVARAMIERGTHDSALVIGSEAISPLLHPVYRGRDPERIRLRDRIGVYTFGDGAGAIVLTAAEAFEGAGVLAASSRCLGMGLKPGMQIVGAGTHAPIHAQIAAKRMVELKIDVVQSAEFTPTVISAALSDLLGASGLSARDISACILPEGNAGYLTDELEAAGVAMADWDGLSGRVLENLSLVGATGSAAVPLALDDAWRAGRLPLGEPVMLLAIETSKWKYSGMVLPWTLPAPLPAGPGARVAVGASR
jgi:3-oxoacyl-[acyl-carrier-protein] synthase-3